MQVPVAFEGSYVLLAQSKPSPPTGLPGTDPGTVKTSGQIPAGEMK